MIERKLIPTPEVSETGAFSAVVATFDVVDRDDDVIVKDAFARNVGREIPVLLGHNWESGITVGTGHVEPAAAEAVFHGRFIVDPDHVYGRMAYAQAKHARSVQEFSIGFETLKAEYAQREGKTVRVIKDLHLFEVSLVPAGAQPGTRVLAVKAAWTTAYVNDLPDSAFAVILPGGEKDETGRTVPRDLRKLPHHDANGEVDLPHLRNALARLPQTDMPEEYRERARRHLQRHAEALGIGEAGKSLAALVLSVLDHQPLDHEALERIEKELAALHAERCECKARAPDPRLALAETELLLARARGGLLRWK